MSDETKPEDELSGIPISIRFRKLEPILRNGWALLMNISAFVTTMKESQAARHSQKNSQSGESG